ncbi:protein kinase [Rhizobium sp. AAP43]|uniref:protein kinase domain-containing protein n=1 Tax=Rhizobium sp. AAP43 TaxID=1523420 RepID=UPI0006B97160|nr:protein kinase [Rhizobium sp. AAP43]
MSDAEDSAARRIADCFASLWHLVRPIDGSGTDEFRRMARIQIINALERGGEFVGSQTGVQLFAGTFYSEAVIWSGQMSEVHLVRHRDLGNLQVLKTVPKARARDQMIVERLIVEAKIGVALRHAHLVETTMLLRLEDGRPALILESCGKSLADQLAHGVVESGEIVTALMHLLEGLSALHRAGYVHGDVAAENLLSALDLAEQWKLGDFGLTLPVGGSCAVKDVAYQGRPHYASPEQKAGLQLTPLSDLYSVGMLAGHIARSCVPACTRDQLIASRALQAFEAILVQEDQGKRPADAHTCLAILKDCFRSCAN